MTNSTLLDASHSFIRRHIGPSPDEQKTMLKTLGLESLETLIANIIPDNIRSETTQHLSSPCSEQTALAELKALAKKNQVYKNYIGLGYHETVLPEVIKRNVLENPAWYTAYTPYQPEIAQGRLEGLLHFQQMICDLTGMELANASLLDEGTAAAEAMAMSKRVNRKNASTSFFVSNNIHPQTLAVVNTRAEHFGFNVIVGDERHDLDQQNVFGVLLQYPGSDGEIYNPSKVIEKAHKQGAIVTVVSDLLALLLIESPGALGADIVVGSNQRFGIPMGYGGPHAGFFAFRDSYKRSSPGRIIGVSQDSREKPALRMAMQTREQHIRREKANSNICTSQVLLALLSVFYAMYHGPEGLRAIAKRVHYLTQRLAESLRSLNYPIVHTSYFDTLCINVGDKQEYLLEYAKTKKINLRSINDTHIGISLNEQTDTESVDELISIFNTDNQTININLNDTITDAFDPSVKRIDVYLDHENFNRFHTETEMMRYLTRLSSKDIALNHAMIPLGSCTMKLNAAAEMAPVTWPEFSNMHPFAPKEQAQGYQVLFNQLEDMLMACTGYDAISLQPNAGSQGEYAGLVAIKKYFESHGEYERTLCLIPASAHGTNPASAQMAGMRVVLIACDEQGNVDVNDIHQKVEEYGKSIAALMVTYPSTHGVFEENIQDICEAIHSIGAQVYIDGANMNALVGLAAPGKFGGDVSHLNLHKTFCIPHGGGGPGMGPIGVKEHLAPFVASHPLIQPQGTSLANGTIASAPWGSASILPISWMYIRMMGREGIRKASEIAILNANYIALRLKEYFPILYTGRNGFVAHECLIDLRPIKTRSNVSEEDIAKRLMDFGFHAPTMSFPVAGTLMIEPTESESKRELDRFCDVMIQIHQEIKHIEQGLWPADNNPLVNAPHTLDDIMDENWSRPYTREQASRALPYLKHHKVWPSVNRIDNVYGDRNLMCTCAPLSDYA